MTKVTWRPKGTAGHPQYTRTTTVPAGEFYADWIGQAHHLKPSHVVVLRTEESR